MTEPLPLPTWHVPVRLQDIPETGGHYELTADERTREAIAKLAGIEALPRLAATFDVSHQGRDGLRVAGQVSATVNQICVVTLEPIESAIEEAVDLAFVPGAASTLARESTKVGNAESEGEAVDDDAPEPLVDGTVDLGAIASEFLILGIDPYPRKSDAVFEQPPIHDDPADHPFAALAALQKPGKAGDA